MRKIIVAGNWKMNLVHKEALALFAELQAGLVQGGGLESVLVFPPYIYLKELMDMNKHNYVNVGAQNLSSESNGAFTGEISASMLSSLGIGYSLIGHSERRQFYGEDNQLLKKKVDQALSNEIKPVFCCGEKLAEREKGSHKKVVEDQLRDSLFHISPEDMMKVIIAYEPVWAIGTGVTANTEQAEDMHAHIRELVRGRYGDVMADEQHILYGGSCNASNAGELFKAGNVDGGLIGGASLKADEFLRIVSLANG